MGVQKMKDMTEVLKRARKKKVYQKDEFQELLEKIQSADSNLEIDWDVGAGEDWARLFSGEEMVCMANAKTGVLFLSKNYEYKKIKSVVGMLEVVFTESFSQDEWKVDLVDLEQTVPEIYWHASEGAVRIDRFSLDDLYFATV